MALGVTGGIPYPRANAICDVFISGIRSQCPRSSRHKFLETAVEIGHELGIFDASESAYSGAPELANARLFTAWAVYQHATYAHLTNVL